MARFVPCAGIQDGADGRAPLLETGGNDDMAKSIEEKIETVRKVAAGLRKKALEAGLAEPFISWVMDSNGGTLMLDAPAVSDTSALPPISWDSGPFLVTVFSTTSRCPLGVRL